jgi:hypothetical protein
MYSDECSARDVRRGVREELRSVQQESPRRCASLRILRFEAARTRNGGGCTDGDGIFSESGQGATASAQRQCRRSGCETRRAFEPVTPGDASFAARLCSRHELRAAAIAEPVAAAAELLCACATRGCRGDDGQRGDDLRPQPWRRRSRQRDGSYCRCCRSGCQPSGRILAHSSVVGWASGRVLGRRVSRVAALRTAGRCAIATRAALFVCPLVSIFAAADAANCAARRHADGSVS